MTAAQSSGDLMNHPTHPYHELLVVWCFHIHLLIARFAVSVRFWVLETVARIPYFAFISMLHLYETLGWWRAAAPLRKVRSAASLRSVCVHKLRMLPCVVVLVTCVQCHG